MSRVGKKPVPVPAGVTASIDGQTVRMKGAKGELSFLVPDEVSVAMENGTVTVAPRSNAQTARAKWGMSRAMVASLAEGVSNGFQKRLEINGVGYRAQKVGDLVMFQLGFSHPVAFEAPPGVTLTVEGNNRIVVSGADKELVGETAARIRRIRPPEPYKGKGIKYAEEQIRRKAGKAGGKGKK